MIKMSVEYDFLSWTSFPSSLKLSSSEKDHVTGPYTPILPIKPMARLRIEVNAKQQNVVGPYVSGFQLRGGPKEPELATFCRVTLPKGTFDWLHFTSIEEVAPPGIQWITGVVWSGTGGSTWFDDLKIYQDDALIYSNDFSNWAPIIIPAEIITGAAMIKFIE